MNEVQEYLSKEIEVIRRVRDSRADPMVATYWDGYLAALRNVKIQVNRIIKQGQDEEREKLDRKTLIASLLDRNQQMDAIQSALMQIVDWLPDDTANQAREEGVHD